MRAEREACFALTEPDAGSDATDPHPGGARQRLDINGRKHFITHGAEADYVILFAVTDPGKGARGGISCFLVDTDTPWVRGRPAPADHVRRAPGRAGLHRLPGRPDALLGKEGYGFYSAMRWINGGRVSIAAMAVGVAQHLYEQMLEYAKVRRRSAAGSAPTSTSRG